MKTILVEIKGTTPLLMNNPQKLLEQNLAQGDPSFRKKNTVYDPQVDAEKTAYKTKTGELYIPANCMFSMMIESSKAFQVKRKSLARMLGGTIQIKPEQILLGTKKYEIDSKRIVIQRASVIRNRARIDDWKASFELHFDDEWLPNGETILKEVMQNAGKRVGLLDFRPAKMGPYGTFIVSKWEVLKTKPSKE